MLGPGSPAATRAQDLWSVRTLVIQLQISRQEGQAVDQLSLKLASQSSGGRAKLASVADVKHHLTSQCRPRR